jgi:hypothetical protein
MILPLLIRPAFLDGAAELAGVLAIEGLLHCAQEGPVA